MHSHRLVLDGQASGAEWLMEWDDARFFLVDPDRHPVLDCDVRRAHRRIELAELFIDGRICFVTTDGLLRFKRDETAVNELRELVRGALQSDADLRRTLRVGARRAVARGVAVLTIGGAAFGSYCWFAATAPPPPRGHWLESWGWAINAILTMLLIASFVGVGLAWFGLHRWLRVRGIEHVTRGLANSATDGLRGRD